MRGLHKSWWTGKGVSFKTVSFAGVSRRIELYWVDNDGEGPVPTRNRTRSSTDDTEVLGSGLVGLSPSDAKQGDEGRSLLRSVVPPYPRTGP